MDWKSRISDKLKPILDKTTPLVEKIDPYFQQAQDIGFKALDFTQKQLRQTPLVITTLDQYKESIANKRCILISYDETESVSRELLLRSPIWSTHAWKDVAHFRFIERRSAPEIVEFLGITSPVDMRVYLSGKEISHFSDIESIKNWWKNRSYEPAKDEVL